MATSVKQLIEAASAVVPKITPVQAQEMIAEGNTLVVDVRDAPELEKSGKIAGAVHHSRGMLEFRADPASPFYDTNFAKDKTIIIYCASGGRAALAGKALKDMGYDRVYNVGAFKDWADNGGVIEKPIDSIAQHYEIAGQAERAVEFYRRAAQVAQRVYANGEAIGYYQHLLESDLAKHLSPENACAIKLALGEVWRVNGQWPQAEAINREALAQAEKLGAVLLQAQAQRALADVMRLQGHYDAALEWLTQAEAGFESAGNQRGVVSTLWTMGEVYWFKGDHKRSLAALDRQLQIATEIDDQRGICEALDTMGMVYWSQGDWDRSVECCLKSIAIAEPLGYKLVITRAAITLGNVGLSRHDYPFATQWYRTAYEVAREIDDRQVVSWALVNISLISNDLGDFQRTLAYHLAALRINLEIDDTWTACQTLANIGEIVKNLGAVQQASQLYQWAIDLARRLNIPSYLSGMLSSFAALRLEQQCIDEAATLYAEALTLASQVAGERLAGDDVRFELAILDVQVRQGQGSLTVQAAIMELEQLLSEQRASEQQAALHYAAWRMDPTAEWHRAQAAELYRTLGLNVPLRVYRQRYLELTGETLPEPPLLPNLPDVEIPDHLDIEALMTHLTAIADKLFDRLPRG